MKSQLKNGQFTLTPIEVEALVTSAPTPRDRLIVRLMVDAGLRRNEVINLKLEDVAPVSLQLRIVGKGNKVRIVPIPKDLAQDIVFYAGKRRAGLLFPSKRNIHRGLTPCLLNKILDDTARRARVPNPNPEAKTVNCHLLRHTYARALKSKGVSIEAIQNILGHSSYKTTMDVYGLMSQSEIQKEYAEKVCA